MEGENRNEVEVEEEEEEEEEEVAEEAILAHTAHAVDSCRGLSELLSIL